MKWYYKIEGGHTHVRVFMNGAKCGDLCFRNEEFEQVRRTIEGGGCPIEYFNETPKEKIDRPHKRNCRCEACELTVGDRDF